MVKSKLTLKWVNGNCQLNLYGKIMKITMWYVPPTKNTYWKWWRFNFISKQWGFQLTLLGLVTTLDTGEWNKFGFEWR